MQRPHSQQQYPVCEVGIRQDSTLYMNAVTQGGWNNTEIPQQSQTHGIKESLYSIIVMGLLDGTVHTPYSSHSFLKLCAIQFDFVIPSQRTDNSLVPGCGVAE